MQGESISQIFSELLFSLVVFFRTFFQALGLLPAPCEQPLEYTIGTIDERFGITEAEVLQAAQRAETLWETAAGLNVFEYNEEEGLPVQFVYDERQQKTQAEQDLQSRLDSLGVGKSEAEAKKQIAEYEQALAEYKKALALYERDAESYNNRVERINKNGGATESQQQDLQKQYDSLQDQFQEVEAARQKVNSLVGAANQRIAANQQLVEAYNTEITTFQEQYGGEGEIFDQGVYTGTDITIYQYGDASQLTLVLAHEMGHALGIDHGEDPKAIMYYLMRDQDVHTITPTRSDIEALKNICQPPKFPWKK